MLYRFYGARLTHGVGAKWVQMADWLSNRRVGLATSAALHLVLLLALFLQPAVRGTVGTASGSSGSISWITTISDQPDTGLAVENAKASANSEQMPSQDAASDDQSEADSAEAAADPAASILATAAASSTTSVPEAGESSAATSAAASSGGGAGGASDDPFAGAAPSRGGSVAVSFGTPAPASASAANTQPAVVLDEAAWGAIKQQLTAGAAGTAATLELVVKVEETGTVIDVHVLGGTAPVAIQLKARQLLIGRKLYQPSGGLSEPVWQTLTVNLGGCCRERGAAPAG